MKKETTIKMVVALGLLVVLTMAGLYAGGAVFLKATSIDMQHLRIDTLYFYWVNYGEDPEIQKWLTVGLFVCLAVIFVPLVGALILALISNTEEIHGSARFANDTELAKSGFFKKERKEPVLLLGKMHKGRFKGRYVEAEGNSFVGVSAPTGQGKGIGFVLPNLVNYSDSVICLDIKLENFVKSAGYRKSCNQEVYLFAPDGYSVTNSEKERGIVRSHRWNAFSYVRINKAYRVGDVQLIGNSLYPLTGDGKADMWQSLAASIFSGLVFWMFDTQHRTGVTPTFPYLLSLLGVEGGLYKWLRSELDNDGLSDECVKEFRSFLNYPKETQGSILATLEAPLSIFQDKTVAAAVSGNDFDFRELRRKGITIYVGVQPPNKGRFGRLLNLFFEQFIAENTRTIPELDSTLKYQLLMLGDEFPVLGRVNQIKESIGYTRQYNLRYALVYQDKSQLEDKTLYGKEGADNIISNLLCEIIYPPSKVTPRVEEISKSLGTKTVKVRNNSFSMGGKTSRTENYTLQRRELLKPHEIVELGYEKHSDADISVNVLMFKQNQRPFIMKKLISFADEAIANRIDFSKRNVPDIPALDIK